MCYNFFKGVTDLPDFITFKPQPGTPLRDIFTAVKDDLIDVLSTMLSLNPLNRCTCTQALNMPYFSNSPAPTPSHLLPRPQVNSSLDNEPYKRTGTKRIPSDNLAPMAKRLHFDTPESS